MNIVKVAGHACVRMTKMIVPLLWAGHKVHCIARKEPVGVEYLTTYTKCADQSQYVDSIKVYSKTADVFHVHNEPSWFVSAIKESCDVPVVLDVHDSWLARSTPEEAVARMEQGINHIRITTEERNNFQLADALVFPSKPFAEMIIKEFGLKQPFIILPSYLPRQFYTYETKEWLGGLVYEGRVDLKSENDKQKHGGFGFRYTEYEELAQKAHAIGMDFHLYAREDEEFLKVYKDSAFTHTPQAYEKLMGCLSRHDWGLVGNIDHTPEWDVAFPNKLFEYIASSVPVVALNASECGRFVKEHGIGIEVSSLEELAERWSEHTECRKRLIKIRGQFFMDNHIHKLEELYRGVSQKCRGDVTQYQQGGSGEADDLRSLQGVVGSGRKYGSRHYERILAKSFVGGM